MALGVGKAAGWLGKKTARGAGKAAVGTARGTGRAVIGRRGGATAVMGGVAALGVGSAVLDREGPYAEMQEVAFGDRDAIRYSMKAGLNTAFDGSDKWDIQGTGDRYYGRPVDVPGMHKRRSSGSGTPVSGDVVFGLYNLRR